MLKFFLICLLACGPSHPAFEFISFPYPYEENKPVNIQNPFAGRWEGTASTTAEETSVILEIVDKDGAINASISLMDMGVLGWPSHSAKIEDGKLILVFPTDNSQQIITLEESDGSIHGSWQDTRLDEVARIRLKKQLEQAPHRIKTVEINGPAGILSAELVMPDGPGPYPGVVYLHGSGPQPKDASRFAAISLAKQGIASVIYDKRGVGGSAGEWQGADFEDLARDGIAAAEYLSSIENIDKVGFFGHSQGGWLGPLAASMWDKTAFVISSAGPAVSPAREAQWGFINNVKHQGGTEEDIAMVRLIVEEWHEGLRSGIWEPYKSISEEAKKESWYEASGLSHLPYPPDPAHMHYYIPFMDYDPIPVLTNIDVPLYSILTPDDESIDSRETEEILRALIDEGRDIQIKLYPGYNHGFRKIGTEGQIRWPGQPEDYYLVQADFIKQVTID